MLLFEGPRPGVESLLAPFLGVLASAFGLSRRLYILAQTNSGFVLIPVNRRWQPLSDGEAVSRDDVKISTNLNEEQSISVRGKRYWNEGRWASRIALMLGSF